jgi:hypothetical protein
VTLSSLLRHLRVLRLTNAHQASAAARADEYDIWRLEDVRRLTGVLGDGASALRVRELPWRRAILPAGCPGGAVSAGPMST